jgi:methyl-accepting chemotaxis protein
MSMFTTRVRSRAAREGKAAGRRPELDVLREALAEARRVAAAAAQGDSEARFARIEGEEGYPEVTGLRLSFNDSLDRTDAFAREVTGALEAINEGRFYRQVLPAGLFGSFLRGARAINDARDAMIESEGRTRAVEAERLELADRFEETVLQVSEQVAAASTELSATAANLSRFAEDAVVQADAATSTMANLDGASREIENVVAFISSVAAQTKLLALNAQIEAARAGAAGRGFDVVASEVKSLAETTAKSTETITNQVEQMIDVSGRSINAIESVQTTVREMTPMVDDLRYAVDGHSTAAQQASYGLDPRIGQGLAQMAEMLRAEVGTFLAVMRRS